MADHTIHRLQTSMPLAVAETIADLDGLCEAQDARCERDLLAA